MSLKMNNGFGTSISATGVSNIKAVIYSDVFNHKNEKQIQAELTAGLINEAVNMKLVNVYKSNKTDGMREVYAAELFIAPPGHHFVNVENDVFRVDNEIFNEQDIEVALRATYPERFI